MAETVNTLLRFASLDNLKLMYKNLCPHISFFATCNTENTNNGKSIFLKGFQCVSGVRIAINFQNGNVAEYPILSIHDGSEQSVGSYYVNNCRIVDANGDPLCNGTQLDLNGWCELMYYKPDAGSEMFVLISNRQRNLFVYSETEPSNLVEGMIWLKPKSASSNS